MARLVSFAVLEAPIELEWADQRVDGARPVGSSVPLMNTATAVAGDPQQLEYCQTLMCVHVRSLVDSGEASTTPRVHPPPEEHMCVAGHHNPMHTPCSTQRAGHTGGTGKCYM